MNITKQQMVNPGAVDYDKKRRDKQKGFQDAVKKAKFLTKKQQDNWGMLGYMLTTEQLEEAEQLIISKKLEKLHTRHQLEKLKPTK